MKGSPFAEKQNRRASAGAGGPRKERKRCAGGKGSRVRHFTSGKAKYGRLEV
jgi:hypothetical protein